MLRDELLRRFPRLRDAPADAWVVGGAVRDLLLGVEPADVDVACLDPSAAARAVSRRVIRLGSDDHLSAWRVIDGEHVYDFAEILDHNIAADLRRRDFTVNAMAVSLGAGDFLDPHGGRGDLGARVVRMVMAENFDDDPLRCLKAVRMAVKLRFDIDATTVEAIRARASQIGRVAAERVGYELSIIFTGGAFRRAVTLLRETTLDVPLFGARLDPSRFLADDVTLAGAYALLVDGPKPYAKRWRWSADLLRDVVALRQLVDLERGVGPERSRRGHAAALLVALYDAGEEVARQLAPLLKALGRQPEVPMPDFSIRALLSGDEIASIRGIEEGPDVGRLKRALLEAQIRGEVQTRDEAIAFITS